MQHLEYVWTYILLVSISKAQIMKYSFIKDPYMQWFQNNELVVQLQIWKMKTKILRLTVYDISNSCSDET